MKLFSDISINDNVKKDKTKLSRKIDNPILYSNSDNPQLVIVVDKLLSQVQIQQMKYELLDTVYPGLSFQVLYCFHTKPEAKHMKANIGNYFKQNSIDIKKYIKPGTRVLTFGRALYSFCYGNTDLNVKMFYDFKFNDSYFRNGELKTRVYPVDDYFDIISKDNFSKFFALRQIKECLDYKKVRFSIPELKLVKVLGVEEVKNFLLQHMESKEMAWDLETTGLNFQANTIGCFTCSFDGRTGYYLRWKDIEPNIELFDDFLKNKYSILANGKFDQKFVKFNGIENIKIDFDTLHAGHILNEMRSNSLKTHACIYTWHGGYDDELDDYKRKYKKLRNYMDIPEKILYKYATMDSIVTFQVYQAQKLQLDTISRMNIYNGDWTINDYFYNAVMPSVNTFIDIEYEGVYYDWDKLEKLSKRVRKEIDELKLKVYEALDIPLNSIGLDSILYDDEKKEKEKEMGIVVFKEKTTEKITNLDSNIQVSKILKEKGWTNHGTTKLGHYIINDDTLNKWIKEGHKAAELLLELHQLNTVYKTFIGNSKDNSGFFKYRYPDGRLHPNFAVMLKNSGRNGARNPNLQNIKARGYLAEEIRSCFITLNEEYGLADCDLSGAQLRYACMRSGDEVMKNIFLNLGGDMHSMTGYEIFIKGKKIKIDGQLRELTLKDFFELKKKGEKIIKKARQNAKTANFSLIFGTSALSFCKQSIIPNWTPEEAKTYIKENGLIQKRSQIKDKITESVYDYKLKELEGRLKEDDFNMFEDVSNVDSFAYFWTVAIDIREKFFKLYPGLADWIEKMKEEARSQGFVVSPFGCIRRLPELLYIGKDSKGGHIKNLYNISLNTTIQNMEVVNMNTSITKINNHRKENNLKSSVFNTVHDSVDSYIHYTEEKILSSFIKETLNKPFKEWKGIPMESEGEMSYPMRNEKPSWWGFSEDGWF